MIYLDNHSTTRVDPSVIERMLPYFGEHYGNAASNTHEMGRVARQAVEESRGLIAASIGAEPGEIYFTSGATESNNLALRGIALHRSTKIQRLVTATTEHRAILDPVRRLAKEGFDVTWLQPATGTGEITVDAVRQGLVDPAALVSLMLANNEIGTCLPVGPIGAACREAGVKLHCDAAQALGRMKIEVHHAGIDLLSLSAHKVYGPKGIGALFVRQGTRLKAILDGGGHEGGKRSGTLNVPGIVGFARAVELAMEQQEAEEVRIRELMELCDSLIRQQVGGAELNGPAIDQRLLGNLNYRLEGINAETLALRLPEVCLSTGSACTSAEPEPSHVLQAIGLSEMEARGSIRIGIGRFNTDEEIREAIDRMAVVAKELRQPT